MGSPNQVFLLIHELFKVSSQMKIFVASRKLINTFLCLSQVLSNSVYVLFMAQNIEPVRIAEHFFSFYQFRIPVSLFFFQILVTNGGEFFQNLNYRFYILMLLGPIILICMIRNLRLDYI